MPFHQDIQFMSVGIAMATSFAFWYVVGYVMGGDKIAPAIIGMAITGIRGAIAGTDAVGQMPDNLGMVSSSGYGRGSGTGQGGSEAFSSAVASAIVTFIFWIIAGYFVISGSAWKYALTAATIAAVGSVVSIY